MNKLRSSIRQLCAITASVTLVAFFILAVYVRSERSFEDYVSIPIRQRPSDWFSHVKIGIIGDSWVEGKKLDVSVRQLLAAKGLNADVVSSGHSGVKSRQLYRDLFADSTTPYSSNSLLMDDDLDYLVVVTGVNDTAGYIGRDFYAHHMLGIMKAAQDRGVETLCIEVPDYGIDSLPFTSVSSWGKQLVFRYLFDGGKVNVIEDYRSELLARLGTLSKPVTVISFDPKIWHYEFNSKLYINPSHLNQEGSFALSSLIADELIALHNKTVQ